MRLRPGGATRIVVVPHTRGAQLEREHRQLRRLVLELARDADPNRMVEVELNLYEALYGNFGDAGRGGVLAKLEIEQWHTLSQGNGNAANKVLGRARRQGCLEPPVASGLCHIPAGQEALQGPNGNTELVNVARSQQRLLGCQV